jgi:hypothetical protein
MGISIQKAVPHQLVSLGLTGWSIRERFIPFRKSRDSKLLWGMNEAVLIVGVVELMKEIELSLKEAIEQFLRKTYGAGWWLTLPARVQQNAQNRYKWSIAQIGVRRAGAKHNVAWLSMGDVIRVLGSLSPEHWTICLEAETKRQKELETTLFRVKLFRDNYLAHPKPRSITDYEFASLCKAAQRLPQIVRSREWKEVLRLLDVIKALPPGQRSELWSDSMSSRDRIELRRWLSCPNLDPPFACNHRKKVTATEVKWRDNILKHCANLDPVGSVFLSEGN